MHELVVPTFALIGGLVFLVMGGESLVRGASQFAAAMRVSPLVIGLTVVAFATSAPELAVCLHSALDGNADIAIGNAVGSNIFNVLFILGVSALVVPLVVSSQLIRWDVPLMVGASFLMFLLAWDGSIGRLDGMILFSGVVLYTWWCVRNGGAEVAEVQEEFARDIPQVRTRPRDFLVNVLWIAGGLVALGLGSNLLVHGAVATATYFGVSQLVIGLTVVSIGTSLPEVVTSVVAAFRGERDIAVGNVVGSNLFNILCVLGLSAIASPHGVSVSAAALRFDIPVMLAVAVSCLPIFFTGNVIARWEGGLFFFYYLAYTTYLVLDAAHHTLLQPFANVMLLFVIPLTVVTLMITVYRAWQVRVPQTP
ncbi:MAG: calcium/sodium antiporter [Pirellulaceae bacterium]|nr:calcium/sodium antiporter [Planctomycetales bacterium]